MRSPDATSCTSQILFNANSFTNGGRKIFYPPDATLEEGYEFVFFGTGDRAYPKDTMNKEESISVLHLLL